MKYLLTLLSLFLFATVSAQNTCHTPPILVPQKSYSNPDPLNGDYCVNVWVEVDYDIYQAKGNETQDFIEGLMGEVATIYAAQDIDLNFTYFYWTEPSPYSGTSSSQYLAQFRQYRETFDGDIATLLSTGASGGIAYVDVLCNGLFGYSFSSIDLFYNPYPAYSWSTMVVAHEVGHSLGSPHTHSCVWNGNNTAIDGCSPSGTSGGCDNPGFPDNGGTIMSYCHLQGSVGINFNKGFHPQPLALMKNRIAGAACVECTDEPDDPDEPEEPADCEEVTVEILLDFFPGEIQWAITRNDTLITSGGPYLKQQMNTIVGDTVCLPEGCYEFLIYDDQGDGLEPIGCSEGLFIVTGPNGEIASGQDFGLFDVTPFCIGEGPNCSPIDFRDVDFLDYSNQNRTDGYAVIVDELRLNGNTWKAIEYEFPENAVVRFDYFVDNRGEIQGIGFVPNIDALYPEVTYNIAGHQIWGNRSLLRQVNGWETIEIPVPADAEYIVFVNDHDVPVPSSASRFRNVEVCSGEEISSVGFFLPDYKVLEDPFTTTLELRNSPVAFESVFYEGEDDALPLPWPNPVNDTLNIPSSPWMVYNIFGIPVMAGKDNQADLTTLPPGAYFLQYGKYTETIIKK